MGGGGVSVPVRSTAAIDATYFWIGHLHSITAAAGRTDLFLCTRHKESPKTAPQIAGEKPGREPKRECEWESEWEWEWLGRRQKSDES